MVEYGLTGFALVPMGTNALTYELCLDIRTKNSQNGLIGFQCIPMGNAALTYERFDLRTPFQYGLSSKVKAPLYLVTLCIEIHLKEEQLLLCSVHVFILMSS